MSEPHSNTAPLVWVLAAEVAHYADLAVSNWQELNKEKNDDRIAEWMKTTTGPFWRRRPVSREEAIRLMKRDNPLWDFTPGWVDAALQLGRAALLAAPGSMLQLSPQQVSWLWPEIDPRHRSSMVPTS